MSEQKKINEKDANKKRCKRKKMQTKKDANKTSCIFLNKKDVKKREFNPFFFFTKIDQMSKIGSRHRQT